MKDLLEKRVKILRKGLFYDSKGIIVLDTDTSSNRHGLYLVYFDDDTPKNVKVRLFVASVEDRMNLAYSDKYMYKDGRYLKTRKQITKLFEKNDVKIIKEKTNMELF